MSTQTVSTTRTQAASEKRSFWDLWKRPRIEVDHISPSRRGVTLAARWNDISIGHAKLEMRGDTAVIRTLHVDPAWRRRNVGRRLLRRLLKHARAQLVTDIHVLATAADAGFYALHGFRPVEDAGVSHDTSKHPAPAVQDACADSDDAYTLMRRHLSFGFVNATPYDGITVKM